MGSMNWLGFSLSQQELPQSSNPHNHQSRLGYNSDELSGNEVSAGECFDLTSDHSTAAQIPPNNSFGILEAFNRTNHHSHQDWNMKSLSTETSNEENYKTGSSSHELSILMNNQQTLDINQNQPKLENFLGRHSSFSNHHHYSTTTAVSDYLYPIQSSEASQNEISTNNNNSSIGLSMIKTWLRNQPATESSPATQSALSLSMSTGSTLLAGGSGDTSSSENNKNQTSPATATATAPVVVGDGALPPEAVPRKSIDTFGQRTSIYRGVTRHRWTGRYEAHLWDNSCRREGQTRKGRQVYLGGYDKEEKAARAYDLAALKYWGTTTTTNFPINNYEKELEEMKHMTRQEYVASLRRKSSGFSRGASIYRGVTRHHQHGRWQARIGRVAGNKDLYLGTFSTQEEAAEAYDIAAIKFRGLNAVTNFDMSRYDVKSILESSTLPIGGAAKRLKEAEAAHQAAEITTMANETASLTDAITTAYATWPSIAFSHQPISAATAFSMNYPNYPSNGSGLGGARVWCKQEVQDHQSFPYHDLQMNNNNNNNTHNFFHQNNSVLHNLMGIDHHNQNNSSSNNNNIEHSSDSNSVMYSGDSGGNNYVIPVSSDYNNNSNSVSTGQQQHEHVYGASAADMAYHRSLYNYMAQQQALGIVKVSNNSVNNNNGGSYDQGSACNNWVPTAVPTIGAVANSTPTFTVWNDA